MVIQAVVDAVFLDQRRHDDGGNPNAVAIEFESPLIRVPVLRLVARWHGCRRSNVIVETAVFVPRDDEQTAVPDGRSGDRIVGLSDEIVAGPDIIERMLRRTSRIVAGCKAEDRAVIRLDKCELRTAGRIFFHVGSKVRVLVDVGHIDSLQGRPDTQRSSGVNPPLAGQLVEYRSVFKLKSIDTGPNSLLCPRRADIHSAGRRSENEKAIRPGWTGHPGKPVVTHCVMLGE